MQEKAMAVARDGALLYIPCTIPGDTCVSTPRDCRQRNEENGCVAVLPFKLKQPSPLVIESYGVLKLQAAPRTVNAALWRNSVYSLDTT